ncbi:MAG: response regulator transcription factor [Muribaculaceae bacterium]|nr:response regulator transcription factor [Muribaculaceae bacterium]
MSVTALGKIVVVDNDENISSLLSVNLGSEGYEVVVYDSAEGVASSDLSGVRLIMADAMDGVYTGLKLLQDIKSNPTTSHIGFILCSMHDSERLIIEALDAGADDYIIKPFSLRELVARAKAVIRRHARHIGPTSQGTTLKFHTLTLDLMTKRATDGDTVLTLTKTEYSILELLLKNMNNYVSRAEIYKNVWKDALDKSNDRIVDTNISRLRKKLGDLGGYLVNRSGLGYMMKL